MLGIQQRSRTSKPIILGLCLFVTVLSAYCVNTYTSTANMGGFSRFLNKITSSNDVPPSSQVVQQQHHQSQSAYPQQQQPAYAQQQQVPQQQQHGNGKRVVGYFVSIWRQKGRDAAADVVASNCLPYD